jgi:DNA-binding response OmpR family regulator
MKPTILVIEDDPMAARIAELSLSNEGFKTIVAPNGLKGLKIAQEDPPDLVLLDLMLPGVDGFEVLNRLRAKPQTANVPVVVVSSKSQLTDKQTAEKIGANAYVTKPYKRGELVELVQSLLSERREPGEKTLHGTCVLLVGSREGEEAHVAVGVGLALASTEENVTLVDFRPFSVEHSVLLSASPRLAPAQVSDRQAAGQLTDLIVQHPSGLHLLNNLEGESGRLAAADVKGLLEALLAEGGIVLADLPLYPVEVLQETVNLCDRVLLVAQSDEAALAAAQSALTLMKRSGVDENRISVVLLGLESEEARAEFAQRILGLVPVEAAPSDPAFSALANRLRSELQPASEES